MTTKKEDLIDEVDETEIEEGGEEDLTEAGDLSRTNMMSVMMQKLGESDKDMVVKIFNKVMAGIGKEAKGVPDGAAAKNKASVAMKGAVKEDIEAVFGGQELSEEFKEKAYVLFESAVEARVAFIKAELEEENVKKLEEEVATITESLVEKVDEYIDYAATTWMEENKVAIESSLRTEIAEQFIAGLANLFQEHNMHLPEEKVDVAEALAEKVKELEEKLNESLNKNMELTKLVEVNDKDKTIAKLSEGLTLSQTEKFRALCEGVESDGDQEAFEKKLTIIKEHHFSQGKAATTNLITEEITHSDDDDTAPKSMENVPVEMRSYVSAISRTIKR